MLKIKSWVAAIGLTAIAASSMAAELTGAGATFPFPVYAKWAEAYKAKTGHSMNYQSIGSSGGIKQIKAKTVDFGATDAPLSFEELEKEGLVQFPAIIGGVVPVLNVDGIKPGQIKMTGEMLADIFAGVIPKWNDKRIADINPGVALLSTLTLRKTTCPTLTCAIWQVSLLPQMTKHLRPHLQAQTGQKFLV